MPLTITCWTEAHAPTNPHTKGEAYDVRSRSLTDQQKTDILWSILTRLSEDPVTDPMLGTPALDPVRQVGGGYATRYFFGFLELADTNQQHFHIQRRRNRVYPPV